MKSEFELDTHFKWFLDKFGEPTTSTPVTNETLQKFKGRLPSRLLEYWQEYGFCGFMDGFFWIVDPDDYEDVLDAWIDDTFIVETDSFYVIGRNAFGDLYLWGERTGYKYKISTSNGWIIEKVGDENDIKKNNALRAIKMFFYKSAMKVEAFDFIDIDQEPLFGRCKELHNPLEYDEVFAFEPAIFLGGEPRIENITKVNIFAHLTMLASFGEKEILNQESLIAKAFD